MQKRTVLILMALFGTIFAGPYTTYCMDQTDPCFQSNCYKVNGNWEYNSTTGKYDCMYDTRAYTDSQVSSAFATCIEDSNRCEQMMGNGGTYTYSGSNGSTESPSCCGTPLIFLGVASTAAYMKMKKQ